MVCYMLDNFKNTNLRGTVGLAVAIAYFSKKGYIVSIPLNDSHDYDLIVDDGSKLSKVQVKTVFYKQNGFYKAELRTRTTRGMDKDFSQNSSDYLYIYTNDGDEFLIPASDIKTKTGILLSEKYEKYKVS